MGDDTRVALADAWCLDDHEIEPCRLDGSNDVGKRRRDLLLA